MHGAHNALDRFKYEAAEDLALGVHPGDLPARKCGEVGGHRVRHVIPMAEEDMAGHE